MVNKGLLFLDHEKERSIALSGCAHTQSVESYTSLENSVFMSNCLKTPLLSLNAQPVLMLLPGDLHNPSLSLLLTGHCAGLSLMEKKREKMILWLSFYKKIYIFMCVCVCVEISSRCR